MQKFLYCKRCGNIVAVVDEKGGTIVCCGEPMSELIPGTVDASAEKHVPTFEKQGNKVIVKVGEVAHPMAPEHYIEWISLATKFGNQRKLLKPGQEPCAEFALLEGDEVLAVYAYCNLHKLWKK